MAGGSEDLSQSSSDEVLTAGLAAIAPAARAVLLSFLADEVSAAVAACGLLLALEEIGAALQAIEPLAATHSRVRELSRLLAANRHRAEPIAAIVREHVAEVGRGASPEERIAGLRSFFDRAVARSAEASVALYSLGDPEVLAAATAEVVELLDRWGLLGPGRAALEIGCGIGRFETALAGRLREIHGIDVSPGMVATARRRAAGLGNVHFALTAGRDLALFRPAVFDLVFAVDSFPYLQLAGGDVAAAHVREAARVLRPCGDLVLLAFSYRGDQAADRADFLNLCESAGFEALVAGEHPLHLWDGAAFHARLRR
ncbi:MAG TPA: methyltransferase domain-containing protein [Thermoanaerobaculia bacterium]|nr:methyltransferase domain-containing protein [Thermoanaerobaculia bacterium]